MGSERTKCHRHAGVQRKYREKSAIASLIPSTTYVSCEGISRQLVHKLTTECKECALVEVLKKSQRWHNNTEKEMPIIASSVDDVGQGALTDFCQFMVAMHHPSLRSRHMIRPFLSLSHFFLAKFCNYMSDADHDSNTWKFWFVVFGKGLYTKKTDTDAAAAKDDGVHIFNTRAQAARVWARHCRRRHSAGCHETKDPTTHPSDADSATDDDTEEPRARACVLDRVARQHATGKRSRTAVEGVKHTVKKEHEVKLGPPKGERMTSTARAASRAASVPATRVAHAGALKADSASPEKKISLYANIEDSEDNLFKSDSSAEVPLAASLAASRAYSRATSALSVSSLSTMSTAPSAFSSISGALRPCGTAPAARATEGTRAAASRAPAMPPLKPMVFNRRTRVLYDDLEAAIEEKQPGKAMELVEAAEMLPWISALGRSAKRLYNWRTHVVYDDLKAAVEERKPGDSMQVVEPGEGVEWISALARGWNWRSARGL
ncbi:hypothetical protein K438DRAFT_1776110 [Mycena galopus ATCC 62051]|nr:hypothetical protein K438DRAFT_1776110 [Mycena galopus ATCC 62051]